MLWLCICLPALVREALATSERAAIERLAAWAYQWSSLVSYRLSEHGDAPLLWLELGASDALFGGHAALLARIENGLAQLGYSHRCALAPSPTAAALLVRAPGLIGRCVFTRAQLRTQLEPLPLSLLEQPAQVVVALQAAGLRRIGEVLALPAAALARRFGPQCCRYLAQLTGEACDPRPGWRLPDVYRARCEFDQDVHDSTVLLFPLQRLLQEFQGYLRARDCSVQHFTLELEHHRARRDATGTAGTPGTPAMHDGVTRVTVGLAAPARDAARFLLLARERLQALALPAPIRALQLAADAFTAPCIVQADLFDGEAQQLGQLTHLLDRLRARLGEQAVRSYRCQADHRPERAWRAVIPEPDTRATHAAADATADMADAAAWKGRARPAALLPSPQHIPAPRQILSGPERIESGWWDGADATRDYYVARAYDGARQWVFHDLCDGRWYLQGLWV